MVEDCKQRLGALSNGCPINIGPYARLLELDTPAPLKDCSAVSVVSKNTGSPLQHDIDAQNRPEYRFQQAKYHVLQELLGRFHGFPATGRTPDDAEFLEQLQVSRSKCLLTRRGLRNRLAAVKP